MEEAILNDRDLEKLNEETDRRRVSFSNDQWLLSKLDRKAGTTGMADEAE
ncbi:hypothetical protein [Paraburkholderia sp. RL17-337-BIB-A]